MASIEAISQTSDARTLSSCVRARSRDYVLYEGDSLELLGQFEERTFDLVFVDPPYFLSNGGYTCSGGRRVPVKKGDWDASRGLEADHAFTVAWLRKCQRLLKPSGTIWVTGTQHVIFSVGWAMQSLGFTLLNTITWFKPNAGPNLSCRYFTHSNEILVWASPGPPNKRLRRLRYLHSGGGADVPRDASTLPKTGEAELDSNGDGRVWTILTPRPAEKVHGKHPTQKPLALLERVVDACTSGDDLVLDPFCGSGTTGVAAVARGRRFVGIDMEAEYLDLAKRRIEGLAPSRPANSGR
ncbi:MAG: hypothetical protein AMXMBFR34_28790 [Myxococcaceae bacterium]